MISGTLTEVDEAERAVQNVNVGTSAQGLQFPSVATANFITVINTRTGIVNMYPVNPNDPSFMGH